MFRSYKLQLKPTVRQQDSLNSILALSCDLYNAALQERRDAWTICRESVSYSHQQKQLTEIRATDVDVRAVAVDIAREPLRRVDRAFKAFFRRCKSGPARIWQIVHRYSSMRQFKLTRQFSDPIIGPNWIARYPASWHAAERRMF